MANLYNAFIQRAVQYASHLIVPTHTWQQATVAAQYPTGPLVFY